MAPPVIASKLSDGQQNHLMLLPRTGIDGCLDHAFCKVLGRDTDK